MSYAQSCSFSAWDNSEETETLHQSAGKKQSTKLWLLALCMVSLSTRKVKPEDKSDSQDLGRWKASHKTCFQYSGWETRAGLEDLPSGRTWMDRRGRRVCILPRPKPSLKSLTLPELCRPDPAPGPSGNRRNTVSPACYIFYTSCLMLKET